MGGLIDALEIEVPEGVVDHIDDAGGRRIWERCELRALTGDGEVTAKAGTRRGCVTMVGGKTFKWNQLIRTEGRTVNPSGVQTTKDSTGLYTFSGTATGSAFTWLIQKTNAISGHWYFTGTDADIYVSNGTTSARNLYVRQITSTTAYIGIYTTKDREYNTSGRFWFCDMTDTFGAGNEPTTVDAAIAAYKLLGIDITKPQEYDAGSIRSAVPESVVTEGRNINPKPQLPRYASVIDYLKYNPVADVGVFPAGQYTVTSGLRAYIQFFEPESKERVMTRGNVELGNRAIDLWQGSGVYTSTFGYSTFTLLRPLRLTICGSANYTSPAEDIQIIRGETTDLTYTPYRAPITRPIPDAVKALTGYGWGVYSSLNAIERTGERLLYKQRIGRVRVDAETLSAHTFAPYASFNGFYVGNVFNEPNARAKGLATRYVVSPTGSHTANSIWIGVNNRHLYFIENEFYDATLADSGASRLVDAITANPIDIYYVLPEPIITDVTDLMPGFHWEYMVEGDRYEVTEPSGIQVPMESAYFVRYGTAAWVSTPSLMLDMDQMELTGVAPENFEEV